MNTKQTIGAATLAAAALTVGVTTAIPDTTEIEGGYRIDIVNPYRAEVYLDVPEGFTPDIVALKMNDMNITKTLLPSGCLITYPTVVSDTEMLSLDMYVRGEEAATAVFDENGKLIITVKDKYLSGEGAEEYVE